MFDTSFSLGDTTAFVTKSGGFCVFVRGWCLGFVKMDRLRVWWNWRGVICGVEYEIFVGGLDRKVVKVAMVARR